MSRTLQKIVSSSNASKSVSVRAHVVLMAASGRTDQHVAHALGITDKTVRRWRSRWNESFEALVALESKRKAAAFQRDLEEVLSDAPRNGAPPTFSPEVVCQIIALACQDPALSGRPITTWTGRELVDECTKRNIVPSISVSHVNHLLREVNLKPHKSRYWCNTTETDPVLFQHQVEIVCQTYLEAPELFSQHNTHTISIDEMTSIQANERQAPTKRARPGQIAKEEHNYKRHGTLCLIGNWDVVTSKDDLRNKLSSFIEYFHQTFAKPMNWTYTGRPTSSPVDTRPRTWRENRMSPGQAA